MGSRKTFFIPEAKGLSDLTWNEPACIATVYGINTVSLTVSQ